MKRRGLLVLLLPAALRAHTPDVHPVKVTLKADPGVLRVTVEANALNWTNLAGAAVPDGEGPWPEDLRRRCAEYLQGHFAMSVDGRPLEGEVLGGRTVRRLWKADTQALVLIHAVYPLSPGGESFSARAAIFREEWEGLEGRGGRVPAGAVRDFRTSVRWSAFGGESILSPESPPLTLPMARLRRPAAERFLESLGLGARALLAVGGVLALLAAAALFPPERRALWLAAAGALAAGPFLPPALGRLATVLWTSAALTALASVTGRSWIPWTAGMLLGAPCAARLWVAEASARAAGTGFAAFSWAGFALGAVLALAAAEGLRRAAVRGYAFYFRYLTADELERQALFHRRLAARLVAIAGLYWVLSPLWAPR